MTYDTRLAAKLSGNTVAQLRNWSRLGYLVPELRDEHGHRFYSYRDLLALRTVAKLRSNTSLQKIRKAFNSLGELRLNDHLSNYILVAHDNSIRILEDSPDGHSITDLANSPGQMVLATFDDIFGRFENLNGEVVAPFFEPKRHLRLDPDRMGGIPTIDNTRVTFDTIAQLLDSEEISPERVSDFYPHISPEAARDALEFAREMRDDNRGAA